MSAVRVGRRGLESIRSSVTDRDLAVLRSVEQFRLLSAPHVEALHFADHPTPLAATRASRRALKRLVTDRLLVRLERRVGGIRAGSSSFVYALGPIGHRLLNDDTRRRWREPSETFVAHTLAVAQLVVDLTVADRNGATELLAYECEPTCWRTFTRGLGGTETLKPDLHVITATPEHEWWWFVEVDLGTESGNAIARKCRSYHDYWATGSEQDRNGAFPRVLWVADTDRRAGLIERSIASARSVNHDLFTVTTTSNAIEVLTGGGTS